MTFGCPTPPPLPSFLSASSPTALQLTVPIGYRRRRPADLRASPVARPSYVLVTTNAGQCFLRLRRALSRSSFAFLFYARQTFPSLLHSSDCSVSLRFLFSTRRTFPFLCRPSSPFFRLFRSYFVPRFRSSDLTVLISFLFSVLLCFGRSGFPIARSFMMCSMFSLKPT